MNTKELQTLHLALEVLLDTLPNPSDHGFGPSLEGLMHRRQQAISGLRALIRAGASSDTVVAGEVVCLDTLSEGESVAVVTVQGPVQLGDVLYRRAG